MRSIHVAKALLPTQVMGLIDDYDAARQIQPQRFARFLRREVSWSVYSVVDWDGP